MAHRTILVRPLVYVRGATHTRPQRSRWEDEVEGSALTLDASALNPDTPFHRLCKCPAEIEAQAIAGHIGGQIAWKANEPLKKQGHLLRRDAISIISYRDLNQRHLPR